MKADTSVAITLGWSALPTGSILSGVTLGILNPSRLASCLNETWLHRLPTAGGRHASYDPVVAVTEAGVIGAA